MHYNKPVLREVRDLPIGSATRVIIHCETFQGQCPHCGKSETFLPREFDDKSTATKRLKKLASDLCRYMTASEVAKILLFSDDTIRRWDKEILEQEFGLVDLSNVTRILIDEKCIGKNRQ